MNDAFVHRLFQYASAYAPPVAASVLTLVDGQEVCVVSLASLDKLNGFLRRIHREPVSMAHILPDIVVDGFLEPHKEDLWQTATIGDVRLWYKGHHLLPRVLKNSKADITTRAADLILLEYRQLNDYLENTPCFGARFKVELLSSASATLKRGDKVSVGYQTKEAAA